MLAIHLDFFIDAQDPNGCAIIKWRTEDLSRCLKARGAKPLIIEGVLLLDVLLEIKRSPDFLVFVEKLERQGTRDRSLDDDLADTREGSLANQITRYFIRQSPSSRANFRLSWNEI
jgi:hypothetical protein